MDVIQKLIDQGKILGLKGAELNNFVQENGARIEREKE